MDFKPLLPQIPTLKIDTSHIDEAMRISTEISRQKHEYERRQLDALEATANNTAEASNRLNKVIDNQNDYIEALKAQIELQKKQLQISEAQSNILSSVFSSTEASVAIEREIMALIKAEIDDTHPLWDYVSDKGGDVAVAGLTAATPILYSAFKAFLVSKGIILP